MFNKEYSPTFWIKREWGLTPWMLEKVNEKLLENPNPRTSWSPLPPSGFDTPGWPSPIPPPPWERDEAYFMRKAKETLERSKETLRWRLSDFDKEWSRLVKLSALENTANEHEMIFSDFEEEMQHEVAKILAEVKDIRPGIDIEPPVITFERTPEELQKEKKRREEEMACSGYDVPIEFHCPLEGGNFTPDQKEYWQTLLHNTLEANQKVFRSDRRIQTLLWDSKEIRDQRKKEAEANGSKPSSLSPTRSYRTEQIEKQLQSQDSSDTDPKQARKVARRTTKKELRRRRSKSPSAVASEAAPPAAPSPPPASEVAPESKSISEPEPRRSTRIKSQASSSNAPKPRAAPKKSNGVKPPPSASASATKDRSPSPLQAINVSKVTKSEKPSNGRRTSKNSKHSEPKSSALRRSPRASKPPQRFIPG